MISLKAIQDLDLSLEADQNKIAEMVDDSFKNIHPYIMGLAKTWDTNIKFYEGDQWIMYDTTIQRNVQIPVLDELDFIPRPVTNIIPSILWTLASIFTKNKPTAIVFANSDDENDVSAGKVSEAVLDTKWELDNEAEKQVMAILIALLCGTVIRKDFWNPMLSPVKESAPDGSAQQINLGDTDIHVLSPFEVYPDIYGGQFYLQASVTPIEEIVGMFDFQDNGYTGRAKDVQPSKDYSNILQLREQLRTLNRSNFGGGSSSSKNKDVNTAVLVECYIKPCQKYPYGLMIVEANNIPLYVNHSPYYDPKVPDSWHPYTFFKWMQSPLKWHGISLVEQLVPLQRRVNGIDSIIQLNNMTMANPIWMNPKTCGVPAGVYSGRPGLVIDFDVSTDGAIPQRVPGAQLTADIYQERQNKIQAMHEIAGDNLVLQGNQPSGVNTATGLQLLMEQSTTKFNPFYTNWEKFIEHGQQKKLLMISKFYLQNRKDFAQQIKSLSKKALSTEIESFMGADLRDNIQVRIEAGSSIPRSKLVEQQQLLDLVKMNILGDVTPQNPVANAEFLQKFGVRQFAGVTNPDLIKAKFVVSVLKQINQGKLSDENYPPFLPFEDVDIHMNTLIDEMKKPEFSDPKQVFQEKFRELNAVKEAQTDAMNGMIPPQGAPQPGASPGPQPQTMPVGQGEIPVNRPM